MEWNGRNGIEDWLCRIVGVALLIGLIHGVLR